MEQAQDQLTAINISEYGNRELPDNYRPASSPDVPEGRNCANCSFFAEGYCSLWEENVQEDYYCNRWEQTRLGRAKDILEAIKKKDI